MGRICGSSGGWAALPKCSTGLTNAWSAPTRPSEEIRKYLPVGMEAMIKKAIKTNIRTKMSDSKATGAGSPSQLIDARIKKLSDWRGEMLARVRSIIRQADPEMVEEVKWRKPSNSMLGVPVWEHDGIICTGETYKNAVKMTFAKGASLEDPSGLFNSSLEGNTRRAIDLHEGDKIDEKALKALVRAAVALNKSTARR